MNYRHSFHAGNHADVLKHVALLELLRLLTVKDKPLAYLESHAGAGGYALLQPPRRAAATNAVGKSGPVASAADSDAEWHSGIGRLWNATGSIPGAASRYLDAVRAWNAGTGQLERYPGSPALAAEALRPQDRLRLCETQPEIAAELRRRLVAIDPRVALVAGDGYQQALKALLPPPERRGLILVDPPYEAQHEEFDLILAALREALRRFPTGVYAVWYPIKLARTLAPFFRRLAALPAKSVAAIELWVRATDSPLRLNGSGLALLNPPWPFVDEARVWLPWLAGQLAADRGAGWRCHWPKPETAQTQGHHRERRISRP